MLAVSVRSLSKTFGPLTVLQSIDLDVPTGSIYGLLGLNGAGKTTLLRILMGFLRPTGGSGEVLSLPLGRLEGIDRARVAYVPEQPVLYSSMRVGELLRFVRSVHPRWDQAAAERYMETFRLPLDRKVAALSVGMRSQLALSVALSTRPQLLVLDEPASGLDPLHRRRYLQVLLEECAVPERTVLLTSQDLELVERMCDHVALIHEGRVQFAGPVEEVLGREKRLRVTAGESARETLAALSGVRSLRPEAHGFLLSGAADPSSVQSVAGVTGVQVFALSIADLFWSYVED